MRWPAPVATVAATLIMGAPAGAQVPTLAGSNQISGDRSGALDVRLAQETRVSFDWLPERNTTFAIRAEGFGGVMLRRLDVSDGLRTIVAAARFEPQMLCGGCEAAGETIIVGIDGIEAQASTDYSWRIPAGRYRLYLLTDGQPVTVRIAIPGAKGTQLLHAAEGVDNPVPEAIPQLGGIPSGPFSAFARGDRLDTIGALLWGGLVYMDSDGDVEMEGCIHPGAEPVTTAFAPGCPSGSSEGNYGFTYLLTEATSVVGAGFVSERESGDWSPGGNVTAAGEVAALGWARVVLPFRGNGTVIPPPALSSAEPARAPASSRDAASPAAQTQRRPRIRLLTRSARVRRGRAAVRLGCSGEGTCTGTIRIGRGAVTRFAVPAGHNARVRAAVPRAVARRVQRRGRAAAVVTLGTERLRVLLRR